MRLSKDRPLSGEQCCAEGQGQMPILFGFGEAPGETLELVFVFITFIGTLAILAALGHWWQR